MRILTSVGVSVACALLLGTVGPKAAPCDPVGNVRFICDQLGPEDLLLVPGGEWVLSSGYGTNGAIRLISVRDRTTTVLFPTDSPRVRPDTKTYNSCPGPIDLSQREKLSAHGLYLRPGRGSVHTVYLVHHGTRESIEVFEFDGRAKPPTLTWIGCVVAPDPIGLNSVVGLSDGGFVTTNFAPREDDAARAKTMTRMRAGDNVGEVWEWHTASGWQKVPGSDVAGPNGLEISKDGKWLYIGAWGNQAVVKLSRGQTPVKKEFVDVGFRVDNVRLMPDGSLLAAGQGGTAPSQTSNVAKVDMSAMKSRELVRYPFNDTFSTGTVAIQVGREIWVGSVRGDRIAIFPATQQQSQ
jgi:hypothetical protein